MASGKAQGWTFYLTAAEVVFEVVVRLIFAALVGIVLGTILSAAIAPFLWHFKSSRERIADWATKVAVFLVVFLDSRFALTILIKSWWSNHGPRFTTALLTAHFLAFVVALCIPRARREVVTSLDGFLGEKMTRRTAIATVAGTAALVATEFALSKASPTIKAALAPQRPKSNILLITFDALCAEDMSLYGYRLPTTPNIDAFARKATVFTNFYSASTFTTPCVATMLTGLYPSESHVYQMQGRCTRSRTPGRLFRRRCEMPATATGAFLSNSNAYYLAEGLQNAYDFLPEPTYPAGWAAAFVGRDHAAAPEFRSWKSPRRILRSPGDVEYSGAITLRSLRPVSVRSPVSNTRAGTARQIARWIFPVGPRDDAARPISSRCGGARTFHPWPTSGSPTKKNGTNWKPHYEPDQQSQVDQRRLRYDEFIATARPRLRLLHVGPGKQREIDRTQPSSCRPIMGKALRAASINMRALIRPGRLSTSLLSSGRRASRKAAGLLLQPTRRRLHPRFSSSPVSRNRIGCAANRWWGG